jgi:tRNA nucleotidyltransferase (CCA-adding enzyme)
MREILADPDWADVVNLSEALLAAATQLEPSSTAKRLAEARPERPSTGVELARGAAPLDIVGARVAGAHWLDDWVHEWRKVALEIDGTDLLEQGVAQGPALGRGLDAALRAKLDGEISGRADELSVALRAAT